MRVRVVDDPARACAAMLLSAALSGAEVVLAGGSTPRAAYQRFADETRAIGLELADTRFWFGDERCVGPEDERSNYGMVKEALLDPLSELTDPVVCRIEGELGHEVAADRYEEELRDAGAPPFDFVLLGIGRDGHTASLFPDQPSLAERSRLVVVVPAAGLDAFVARVTLTHPALAGGRAGVVSAPGREKAVAAAEAFGLCLMDVSRWSRRILGASSAERTSGGA